MAKSKGIGTIFQEETKLTRQNALGEPLDWKTRPKVYKEYPESFKIPLPAVSEIKTDFFETLKKRKSERDFASGPLSQKTLSLLLWAAGGIGRVENGFKFRTVPSAGALYPLETYLAISDVEGLERGIYHYSVRDHSLELLERGFYGKYLAQATLGDGMCNSAQAVFIWSAVFYRALWKYAERAWRYLYLDAGHLAQNLLLATAALGLSSCPIAAFLDDEINSLLKLDDQEENVLYLCAVGKKK